MILEDRNVSEIGKSFSECSYRTPVWISCDYCGTIFTKSKKEVLRSHKNIDKDSCSNRICSSKKRAEVQSLHSDDFLKKSELTSLRKYGYKSAMQNSDVQKKRTETCMDKYGVSNYTQTNEYWEKRKETCLKKYGVEHPHQCPEVIKKVKETNLRKYGVEVASKSSLIQRRYADTCLQKYGVPNPLCLSENRRFGKTQKEIETWLNQLGFNFSSNYEVLNGRELDLYDADKHIAIEYCGLHWHHEKSPQPRCKSYHYRKHCLCEDKRIQLLTIFEDEWLQKNDICRSLILSKLGMYQHRIGARKCQCETIGKNDANEFYDKNHILGKAQHSKFFCGLIFDGNLVMVASLGRHPRSSQTLVMDRLCSIQNHQIVGGAARLLQCCKTLSVNNGCKSIITWSDNRWSSGNVYRQLGFSLDATLPPDYYYVDVRKPYRRISKQSQKKSNTGCPSNITEYEWATQHGLSRIWDCGKRRWKIDC